MSKKKDIFTPLGLNFQNFTKIRFLAQEKAIFMIPTSFRKKMGCFCKCSTKNAKNVKRVQYFWIFVKFEIFSFSRENFCSSACIAGKALEQNFCSEIQKYCASAPSTINGFEIGQKARFLDQVKIWSSKKRKNMYKKSSRKRVVRDIHLEVFWGNVFWGHHALATPNPKRFPP